jgi:hypothetical protein
VQECRSAGVQELAWGLRRNFKLKVESVFFSEIPGCEPWLGAASLGLLHSCTPELLNSFRITPGRADDDERVAVGPGPRWESG